MVTAIYIILGIIMIVFPPVWPKINFDNDFYNSYQKHTHTQRWRNSQRLQTVESMEAVCSHGNDPIVVKMPMEKERLMD